jgi:integrase/recombinase XerD
LRARHVLAFLVHHIHDHGAGWAGRLRSVLRSFLRFLYVTGRIPTDLTATLPPVSDWRQTLPARLAPHEVKRLLRCCDRTTAKGRRDYAILLLLVRLGLRACEVKALTLDDIDWKKGEIIIVGKGARRGRLPLPHDVGEAVAQYIKHVRPRCLTRQVFVRMRAPCIGFTENGAINPIVKKALLRANLHPPRRGSHLLRHTCATALLRRGASLSEVGEILRHRDLRSTSVYAKVDKKTLRTVSQPWRGGGA